MTHLREEIKRLILALKKYLILLISLLVIWAMHFFFSHNSEYFRKCFSQLIGEKCLSLAV